MKRLQIPPELRIENYERRVQEATFDRIDLVINFRAGVNRIGATVRGFKYAIAAHDNNVKVIEEKMSQIDELRQYYRKKNRLFRNLDSAWNVMLDNANDFYEYQELLPRMRNAEQRLKLIQDVQLRTELEEKYERFLQLQPKCSKQLVIYETFSAAREVKDEAMRAFVAAEAELLQLRQQEKQLSAMISEDHILADESQQSLSALFPNVHPGYILKSINGEDVEHLPYEDVMFKVLRAKSPNEATFLRYDYRYDPFDGIWRSLQQLRELGVCVEDPLLQRANFVTTAARGSVEEVRDLLLRGEDPDSADLSGNTALVVAAANRREEVVQLLVDAGADVNCRDKNMMTPLLFCVSRGYWDMVRLLVEYGANRHCADKNNRSALYYSVLSGNVQLVELFLRPERCNEKDSLWGFTPLHLAANQGDLKLAKFLIDFGCSIYAQDKKGRTAEKVAEEARHVELSHLLRDERRTAAGQLIFRDETLNANLWIGDNSAMEVRWCADADISAVLNLRFSEKLPRNCGWLTDRSRAQIDFLSIHIDTTTTNSNSGNSNSNSYSGNSNSNSSNSGGNNNGGGSTIGAADTSNAVTTATTSTTSTATTSTTSTIASTIASTAAARAALSGGRSSWEAFSALIPQISTAIIDTIKGGDCNILICDDSCDSLAPAALTAALIIKYHIRVRDALELITEARPNCSSNSIGSDMMRGLQQLQKKIDDKILRRMRDKARTSVSISTAF